MARSLTQQFNYCIQKASKQGQSKHSAKHNGTYKSGELYGSKTITSYRDTAKNFSNWLNVNYPEIKEVREINADHVQEWINERSANWSKSTLDNHITKIKYLEQQAKNAYGKDNISFYKEDFLRPETKANIKDLAMEKEDFLKLRENMANSRSFGKDAIEITFRCGLRVDEVAHLKREDIDLKNKTIFVSREGAKNGRERTVNIQDKDLGYFKDLLDRNPDNGYLSKIDSKSINKCIRRYMKTTLDDRGRSLSDKYEKATDHAIRKLYATERMKDLRGDHPLADKKQEMKCWGKVCKELGHSENRESLYKVYCKG